MQTSRAIALQGIGSGPALVALQGFDVSIVTVQALARPGGGSYRGGPGSQLTADQWRRLFGNTRAAPIPKVPSAVPATLPGAAVVAPGPRRVTDEEFLLFMAVALG